MERTIIKSTWDDKIYILIVYTVLIILLLITLYPLIYIVSASLSDPLSIIKGELWLLPKNINLNAYKKVFQNSEIMTGYRNSIIYTGLGTLVNIIATVMAAYPLSRRDFKGRNFLVFFFTFTLFFNGGLIPTYLIYKKIGFYNNLWTMIIPNAVNVWNLIIMRTYFSTTIPVEIQEAAHIDGCSNIGILTRIVLPLSKPILAVMLMYYGVDHWNSYFRALVYLSDRWRHPLQLVLRSILIQQNMSDMVGGEGESLVQQLLLVEGMRYSVIVVASAPMLILYPFLQKYFVKGVMMGAIKG